MRFSVSIATRLFLPAFLAFLCVEGSAQDLSSAPHAKKRGFILSTSGGAVWQPQYHYLPTGNLRGSSLGFTVARFRKVSENVTFSFPLSFSRQSASGNRPGGYTPGWCGNETSNHYYQYKATLRQHILSLGIHASWRIPAGSSGILLSGGFAQAFSFYNRMDRPEGNFPHTSEQGTYHYLNLTAGLGYSRMIGTREYSVHCYYDQLLPEITSDFPVRSTYVLSLALSISLFSR